MQQLKEKITVPTRKSGSSIITTHNNIIKEKSLQFFNLNEEGALTIFQSDSSLYKSLCNTSHVQVYMNGYTLWITGGKNKKERGNQRGKLLQSFKVKPREDGSIVIDLGDYIPSMLRRYPDGRLEAATSKDELAFFFRDEYMNSTFFRMNANGEIYGVNRLLGDNIKCYESLAEYDFGTGVRVKVPCLRWIPESEKRTTEIAETSTNISLDNLSIESLNSILNSPLTGEDYLYLRPIISKGENFNTAYLLPVQVYRQNGHQRHARMVRKQNI